jgi:two-component system LytT family response regulator
MQSIKNQKSLIFCKRSKKKYLKMEKKEIKSQNEIRITLRTNGEYKRVSLIDINCITSDSYLSIVNFINNEKPITVVKLLKAFEEDLSDYGFIRISRDKIVNKLHVVSIEDSKNRKIVVKGCENMTISRRFYPEIIKIFEK